MSARVKQRQPPQAMQGHWEKHFAGCVERRVAFLAAEQGYSRAFAMVDHRSSWDALW